MKKRISFTASYVIDVDDEDEEYFNTFEGVEDNDWDNVGRPLDRLRDLGWEITNTKINDEIENNC